MNSNYETLLSEMKTEIDKSLSESATRINLKELLNQNKHWGEIVADQVIDVFPDLDVYTCAAGISPSGIVHFGNFRDVMTAFTVAAGLKKRGKNVRFLFSWDDFDRFRKVPNGLDESFNKYIGMPLSKIPDPKGELESYAKRFELEFEASMKELDIDLEYRYQTKEYESGRYDESMFMCLKERKKIAAILFGFMSEIGKEKRGIEAETYIESYYPINLYSRFSGTDNTEILSYDGETTVEYFCHDTKQKDTVDLSKDRIAKLSWKIDWPMRWEKESVNFEPGGFDHSTPGGSYDTSTVLSRVLFHRNPPIYAGYDFIGIRGNAGKMSGSKGGAISPAELLEIYEPDLLRWLYLRVPFNQKFDLSFDSEIIRQYDEFDRERLGALTGEIIQARANGIMFSLRPEKKLALAVPVSIRKLIGYSQIVQWDILKLCEILDQEGVEYDKNWLEERMGKAKNWLEKYNPDAEIKLNDEKNLEYYSSIDDSMKEMISELKDYLVNSSDEDISTIEAKVYSIPKRDGIAEDELKKKQREFFKVVYNLLLSANQGPRLSTFLWAVDREKIIELLSF